MKPILYNLMLLAGLAAVSCAEIPQEAGIPEYDLLPGEILFSGSMETYPGTKSSAGPDGTVTWDRYHDNTECGFKVGKHELLPFPATEMNVNPNMTQNPGWGGGSAK